MRQEWTEGSIVQIPVDDGSFSLGRVLVRPSIAIYDSLTEEYSHDIEDIVKLPILFITGVYEDFIASGRWKIIGQSPLQDFLINHPPRFLQDRQNPYYCRLVYRNGEEIREATVDECKDLEPDAIWEPEAIEQRIRDYYAGHPNQILVVLSLVIPPDSPVGPVRPFTIATIDGETLSVHEHFNRPVVINFWALLVIPCMVELERLESAYQQFKDDGLLVIGLNVKRDPLIETMQRETKQTVRAYAVEHKLTFPIAIDEDHSVQQLYDVGGILPQTIFIDSSGVIQQIVRGRVTAGELAKALAKIGLPGFEI